MNSALAGVAVLFVLVLVGFAGIQLWQWITIAAFKNKHGFRHRLPPDNYDAKVYTQMPASFRVDNSQFTRKMLYKGKDK